MADLTQQELEEAEALRRKQQSAQSVEQTPLTKNEETLRALIENRSKFFSQDSNNSDTENKKKGRNFLNEFLFISKDFDNAKGFLENIAISAKLPALAESLELSFDRIIEKYNPSSPEETARINKIKNGGIDPREIKLSGGENLVEQFAKEGVDLQFINEKVRTLSLMNPFSKYHQFIPIKLEDGRTLNLDVKKYAKDAFEHYQLKHNEQQNTQPDPKLYQENHNLPGFLALYAKEKFLEKYPQERSNFLSKKDEEAIAGWKKRGEFRDQETEEFLIKIGFKKPPLQKNPQEQNINEGPPSGPQKNPQEPVSSGAQERKGILRKPSDTSVLNYLPTPLGPKQGVRFTQDTKPSPAESSWAARVERGEPSKGSGGRP